MLEAFEGRLLQDHLALLKEIEGMGITSIEGARDRILEAMEKRRQTGSIPKIEGNPAPYRKGRRNDSRIKIKPTGSGCPSCGSPNWYIGADEDGMRFKECKDCNFSQYIGE